MEQTIRTPDSRVLRVEIAGNRRGRPVVMHHGMPGSGHPYGPHVADATEHGICLIGYDRPGYGGSTAQHGRTVADCAADVSAIANALGFDRIGVWGHSGGGPHALACAARLPELVVGVVALASWAPYDAPGLDYFGGMGQANVDDIHLMLTDEARAREKAVEDRRQMLAVSVEDMVNMSPTLLSPVDAAAHTRELAEFLHHGFHEGLAPGVEGWWDDSAAQLRPWGFELESIRVPVQLWHGRHDRFVPYQHGEWLAARIPGVEAHLTEADGHVTIIQRRIPEVHAWLLERFRAAR
jgi:pimeloyl-ACP methyl ester carboxylesterase